MEEEQAARLMRAYREERNARAKIRLLAVVMVRVKGFTAAQAADALSCSAQSVRNWLAWYGSGRGASGMSDRPRAGRPCKLGTHEVRLALAELGDEATPDDLRRRLRGTRKVAYSLTALRKIMHRLGFSCKYPSKVQLNRAARRVLRRWQRIYGKEFSRLIGQGYAIVSQDESIFVNDPARGKRVWTPHGVRPVSTYRGSHKRFVVYGAIAADGRTLFRIYDKFDGSTFLEYLKDLHRKFGKVAIIMDNAPQHTRPEAVKEYIRRNRGIKVVFLPVGAPQLNAIEEYWHRIKLKLQVSRHYWSLAELRLAVSEYVRTMRDVPDVMAYVNRRSL